jgi:hypothetical protein
MTEDTKMLTAPHAGLDEAYGLDSPAKKIAETASADNDLDSDQSQYDRAESRVPALVEAADVLPSKWDPLVIASDIARGIQSCVRSLVLACALLVDWERRLADFPKLLENFRRALARENVIPRRSARLGDFDKSKLAMLRKIGENKALLLSDELGRYLQPGYSVLYYIVRYYEALPGDHESRLAHLVEDFAREGHLSRDFLVARVNELEKSVKPGPKSSAHNWRDTLPSDGFDLVFATPNHSDLRRLNEFPTDALRCLRVHQEVARNAIAVVRARLADLPIVENKLLPGCGFDGIADVILLRMPSGPTITEAEVMVIGRRSYDNSTADLDWLPEDLDVQALMSRIVPDAKNRLHLFAAEETEGFSCVLGDANWEPVQ